MSEGFDFLGRETVENYHKQQLQKVWRNFNSDFEQYLSLSTVSLETKYSKCFCLVRLFHKNFDEALQKLYPESSIYSQDQIKDEEIEVMRILCQKYLIITLNEDHFQKYTEKVKVFDNIDQRLFTDYFIEIRDLQIKQDSFPMQLENLTFGYLNSASVVCLEKQVLEPHLILKLDQNVTIQTNLQKIRLNKLYIRS